MSAIMLKGLADVAAKGVRTDKGFKEADKMKVAKALTAFVGYDVSNTQVHNHLRKWRTRWQRIVHLRGLSGALWDDDKKMIVLEEQHYLDHTQGHPTDAELLNTPLEHYNYMELCFADKLATGRFSMGSGVPLGKPVDVEGKGKPIVVEGQGTSGEGFVNGPVGAEFVFVGASETNDPSPSTTKKRKRTSVMTEEDSIQVNNMSDAVREIASAINNTCHTETHPELYKAVMDLVEYDLAKRLAVLNYLTEHKGNALIL
ncbi:hypothetical protein CFC21_003094 [Triticum aestivum]|uniref:Myb/SANT-like domain-containing protein n=2 Tax=Triticum TaxID=4564 RepID=A0A9R0QBE1_TRITD|nr:hypothetical protein CFC21_003094 [Triticum aestivum]VAH08503.1 unnamed protein product [Triticum turgidum subsp. durum]